MKNDKLEEVKQLNVKAKIKKNRSLIRPSKL